MRLTRTLARVVMVCVMAVPGGLSTTASPVLQVTVPLQLLAVQDSIVRRTALPRSSGSGGISMHRVLQKLTPNIVIASARIAGLFTRLESGPRRGITLGTMLAKGVIV